jgi:opacity protein-like surface antigen
MIRWSGPLQGGGKMTARIFPGVLLLVSLLLLSTSSASPVADATSSVDGVFIAAGGGGNFRIYGIGEGIEPSMQLGAGYRWSWFAVDATFLWNSLEYNIGGDEYVLHGAIGDAHHLDGHHLGGIIHGRAYAFSDDTKANLYATIGIGGRVLIYRSLERVGFPIFGPDIERSGSIWGAVVRAGAGAEFQISSSVFFDISGVYDLTIYEEMVDDEYGTAQSINIVGMVKVTF